MRFTVEIDGDLEAGLAAEIAAGERAVTAAVVRVGGELKAGWRAQVTGAGLGQRLANSIRMNRYPNKGRSLNAASLVYSKASKIVDAFDRGTLIRSKHGFYLAIPTAEAGINGRGLAKMTPGTPTGVTPGDFERITPGGWERRTGMKLRFVARPGRHPLLVADDARIDKRGLAAAKRGRRRRDGILTGAQTVVIFILVPQVRLRKRLDLDRAAAAAAASLPAAILAAWKD